jgi:hypothetical protein
MVARKAKPFIQPLRNCDLREMAKQRGLNIVGESTDVISGAKAKPTGLDQLMVDARRHRFDIVLVVPSTELPEA